MSKCRIHCAQVKKKRTICAISLVIGVGGHLPEAARAQIECSAARGFRKMAVGCRACADGDRGGHFPEPEMQTRLWENGHCDLHLRKAKGVASMPLKGVGFCKGCKEKPQRLANSKSIKFKAAPESTNAMTENDDNEQIKDTDNRNLGCTVLMVNELAILLVRLGQTEMTWEASPQ